MKPYEKLTCLSVILAAAAAATVPSSQAAEPKFCTSTTQAAYNACLNEGLDNFWIGNGKCQNESDGNERTKCLADNRQVQEDFAQECTAQRDARTAICGALGEAPYDPLFERANFVDPDNIGGSVAPNPWLPLVAGVTQVYKSPVETTTVTVTHESKVIDGVKCRVVRDTVTAGGDLVEDTVDWFAQDIYGNVWYCGEATAEYEDGFPANTDGSFQADVEAARPGLIMKAAPAVGDAYRQEFDLGNAEDFARVTNLHGSATTPAATCNGDCLIINEVTPLEPGAKENKYYKAGIGNIMTVDLVTNQKTKLVKVFSSP